MANDAMTAGSCTTVQDCTSQDGYVDETVTCASCESDFAFTASEQQLYYDVHGFVNKPKRCCPCRRVNNQKSHARRDHRLVVEFCGGKSLRQLARCKDSQGDDVALHVIRRWCNRRIRSTIAVPHLEMMRRFADEESLSDLAQSEDPDAIDRELETIRRWCRSMLATLPKGIVRRALPRTVC
jgi:hypothetical protein